MRVHIYSFVGCLYNSISRNCRIARNGDPHSLFVVPENHSRFLRRTSISISPSLCLRMAELFSAYDFWGELFSRGDCKGRGPLPVSLGPLLKRGCKGRHPLQGVWEYLLAFFMLLLLVMLHHSASGHLFSAIAVAPTFLRRFLYMLILTLFFIAYALQRLFIWHNRSSFYIYFKRSLLEKLFTRLTERCNGHNPPDHSLHGTLWGTRIARVGRFNPPDGMMPARARVFYTKNHMFFLKSEMGMQTLTPICKGCGQPIRGNYVNALGADWHPEHLICAACGKPLNIQGFTLHEGQPYHPDCFLQTVASRCAYCGKPLIGEYRVDGWGTTFCKEHLGQFPACEFCGRLVPPTQQEKGAETVRCSICRSSAIESADAARPLFSQVIRWVGSQGLTYNNLRLGLEVCGREHLARLLKQQGHVNSLGATTSATYTQNGRIVRTEINGIAVLWGLPKTLFEGVTVHELGHVWLIVHG